MTPERDRPDGGFAAVEFAVLFPLVLLSIAVVIQLSLWGFRQSVARATVQDVAADAALRGNADSEFIQLQLANHGLAQMQGLRTNVIVVSDATGADRVQVSVSASMSTLFGPLTLPISATASAPVERFRA